MTDGDLTPGEIAEADAAAAVVRKAQELNQAWRAAEKLGIVLTSRSTM